MEDETFFQIQTILENHRINQDMKNDRNDWCYAIIPQAIPNLYEGDVLDPQSNILEEITISLNTLKKKVLKINKTHLSNQDRFDFIQTLVIHMKKLL
jgi:hypothetical protein